MAETHGKAVVEALHRAQAAHEAIHATHRKRVAERSALVPAYREGASLATRAQLGELPRVPRA